MVTILMMSVKIATLGLLKIKGILKNKLRRRNFCLWRLNKILSRDSVILYIYSCDESLVTLAFRNDRSYHNLNFIRIWPENPFFLRGGLGSSLIIWDWHYTRCGLEISHKCDQRVKTKSQKVLVANFNVCRSYRENKEKTGRGLFAPPPILNRVRLWRSTSKIIKRHTHCSKLVSNQEHGS